MTGRLAVNRRERVRRSAVALLMLMVAGGVQAGQGYLWKDVHDPRFGNALFNLYQDKNFSGSIQIASDLQLDRVKQQRDDAVLAQAMLNMAYGLHRTSGAKFSMLFNKDNVHPDLKNYVWFYIAKIRYQRGNNADAEGALANISGALPWELEQQLQAFSALLLMKRGDYAQSSKLLDSMRGKTGGVPFARFNSAVSYLQAKDKNKALPLLVQIGDGPAETDELRALRDRANLGLGYIHLFEDKNKAAIERFERVRLSSLVSNDALLGLGWAFYNLEQFDRALAVWGELSKRNVADVNVQEARVAVPYTLARLGAYGQASKLYGEAMASFKSELRMLDKISDEIKRGDYFAALVPANSEGEKGWSGDVENLTLNKESYYFTQMLASHEFQEAAKSYRDLRYLLMKFDEWDNDLVAYESESRYWVNEVQSRGVQFGRSSQSERLLSLRMEFERLKEQLAAAEQQRDVMALANEQEQAQLDRIAQLTPLAQDAAQRERLTILRGRVLWTIYSKFNERTHETRLQIKDAAAAFEVTARQLAQLTEAAVQTAADQRELGLRITTQRQKIKRLRASVSGALRSMDEHLRLIALADLDQRKEALTNFNAHVAFSVGQGFDPGGGK